MIYRKRSQGRGKLRHRVERHELTAREVCRWRRMDEEGSKFVRVTLKFRFQFEDHPVLVIGSENRRDLALAIGGIKRVFNLIYRNSIRSGGVAVDIDVDLRSSDLEIAADVRKAG